MKLWQIVSVFVGILAIIFVIGLFELGWMKFFNPKYENVKREVFENTQSYTHGKIQDLAKYHYEYQNTKSPEDREALRQVIINRFAEFDESKIKSQELASFLRKMRGY